MTSSTKVSLLLAAMAVGGIFATPAHALTATAQPALLNQEQGVAKSVEEVGYRRYYGGYHRPYRHYGRPYHRRYYGGYYRRPYGYYPSYGYGYGGYGYGYPAYPYAYGAPVVGFGIGVPFGGWGWGGGHPVGVAAIGVIAGSRALAIAKT